MTDMVDETALWEITRQEGAHGRFPLLAEMWVEQGDHQDWLLLNNLHYKAQSVPVGASYWRLRFRGETIGVLVFGMSRPLLKERHAVFPKLTPGQDTQISNIHRYKIINTNFRVIGRMVIDTMYRSAGLAYRFVNLACRQRGFKTLEIQSSMSRYNSFAHRAGFQFAKPIRSLYHQKGLVFMRRFFTAHHGDQQALMEEFAGMRPAMQRKVERELKDFYFDHSPLEKTGSRRHYSEGVVDNWTVRRTISKIQGLCFASPLYGFYHNPDAGRPLPSRLPLLAFDYQAPDMPLDLARLEADLTWKDLEELVVRNDWSRPTVIPAIDRAEGPEIDEDEHQDHREADGQGSEEAGGEGSEVHHASAK